jgi:hypothetical protein
MNCDSATELIALYLYGELAAQEEEDLEEHLHGCAGCRQALDRQKTLHRGFDDLRLAPPPQLLLECRRELFRNQPAVNKPSLWTAFSAMWLALGSAARPAAALTLLSLGFFSARLIPREAPAPQNLASLGGEPILSTIRSVQPDSSGRVHIAFDETRRRLVTGSMSDGNIERLMLAAARDETNAGLRVESMEILKGHASSVDVRDALLNALRNDPNPGVRFKALDALKGLGTEPEVRKTLSYVLQNDQNPGVRIQAIEILTQHQDSAMVGMFQQLVAKESNSYVRQRVQKALEEMNASVGTF